MFWKKNEIEFHVKAREYVSVDEILEVVAAIKKAHPNAKISVEVEL